MIPGVPGENMTSKNEPLILLTNDDGIRSPGLWADTSPGMTNNASMINFFIDFDLMQISTVDREISCIEITIHHPIDVKMLLQ